MESHELIRSLKDIQAAKKEKIARFKDSTDPQHKAAVERAERDVVALENEIKQLTKPE